MTDMLGRSKNQLLERLDKEDSEPLLSHFEQVDLSMGDVLYDYGNATQYVYFPLDSIVSLWYVMKDGGSTEVALVGNDGMIGNTLFMGGETMSHRALVQSAGQALRLPGHVLQEQFSRYGGFHELMLRHTQVLITQMVQTAVCHRHHTVDQQLCRWLLFSLDRLPSNRVVMTQSLIANMLGTRREEITEAISKLQRQGAIDYRCGWIAVTKRRLVEQLACECYGRVNRETSRILTHSPASHQGLMASV